MHYQLPLSFAYPVFRWAVWFRGGDFKAILRNTDFSDSTLYKIQPDSSYIVIKDHYKELHPLKVGDRIRLEAPSSEEILKVKKAVEAKLPQAAYCPILYHLDSSNLSNYTNDEIEAFFRLY